MYLEERFVKKENRYTIGNQQYLRNALLNNRCFQRALVVQ